MREELQNYFRSLSIRSRYNRFLGAMSELPHQRARSFHPCRRGRRVQRGRDHDDRRLRDHRRRSPLRVPCRRPTASNSVCRSTTAGRARASARRCSGIWNAARPRSAPSRLFGDTLRSNEAMIALARKSGFAFDRQPRRLEAGALRKAAGLDVRAAGHSLRELAACRQSWRRSCERGFGELKPAPFRHSGSASEAQTRNLSRRGFLDSIVPELASFRIAARNDARCSFDELSQFKTSRPMAATPAPRSRRCAAVAARSSSSARWRRDRAWNPAGRRARRARRCECRRR